MPTELKPCPFCGDNHARVELGEFGHQVSCHPGSGCGSLTDYRNTKAEAIETWNTRAAQEHQERPAAPQGQARFVYERTGAAIDDKQHNWRVWLLCCGRADGSVITRTWEEANQFREDYTSGPGVNPHGYSADKHDSGNKRAAVITRIDDPSPWGGVAESARSDDPKEPAQPERPAEGAEAPVCRSCHQPQTRNPHPKAGDPSLEFGYQWHCIPCLVKGQSSAVRKWQEYERDYILPCFKWATAVGFDLQKAVSDNPGKNCVRLLVEHLIAAHPVALPSPEK